MIFSSISSGVRRQWSAKRMTAVYYLINLIFGLAVAYPISLAIGNFAGHSLMSQKLAAGLDIDFILEFLRYNTGLIGMTGGLVIVAGALYILVVLFLSGGAFSVLSENNGYKHDRFWGQSAAFFGKFVRLALWSIPAFAVFFLLQFLVPLIVRIAFGSSPYQYVTYWSTIIRMAIGYTGILMYYSVMDYGRIYVVLTGERSMRRAVWHGVRFLFGHFGNAFGLPFILFIFGAIALLLYNIVANHLQSPNTLSILVLILFQQLYMLFRMWLKLTVYASEIALFRRVMQPTVEIPAQIDIAANPAIIV